jgi:hypothetical protein
MNAMNRHCVSARPSTCPPRRFLMWQLQQILEKPQFVDDFKRGGVDRVATEVPQKVRVLLQDENIDARAGQQQTQHDSSRTATRDAAPHRHFACSHAEPES